jgi:UDP-glucose 4-epimerase
VSSVEGGRYLVTGGAGFIGSHLVDRLLDGGAERVVVVDDYFLGSDDNLAQARAVAQDRLVVYRDDARDARLMAEVLRREGCSVVYNLATRALLYSFLNPATAFDVNTAIAATLADLLRAGAYDKLLHVSSSEVYGTAQVVPMDEAHPLLPETSYAAGKAGADLLLASYVRMFDLDITTVRPFNNYGPRQNRGGLAALIPLTIDRLRLGQRPVVQGDGLQTRDFLFVEDTARLLVAAANAGLPPGTVMNVASGVETSVLDIVTTLCRIFGVEPDVEHQPARAADVRRHWADTSRARAALPGADQLVDLDEGLRRSVAWYTAS